MASQIFMGLVVTRFRSPLPAIAGQISLDVLNRIDAVFVKAFWWQLTCVPSTADIADNANRTIISLCPQPHPLLTPHGSIQKILMVDGYALKDMVEYNI